MVLSGVADDHCSAENTIMTLQRTVYFPTSTPARQARLMYRNDGESDKTSGGRLYLVLDKLVHTVTNEDSGVVKNTEDVTQGSTSVDNGTNGNAGGPNLGHASPPVVLRWRIAQGDGWRAWDTNLDTMSSDLKRDVPVWKMLRGQFVDSDKLFSVPIRSGLDWRRKGYLSCSAMG